MATSLTSPNLIFSADKAIIASRKALAKIAFFATDFSAEAVQPGTTMKIPVFKHGVASEFNASTNNYEKVDGSVIYPDVTFDHHVKHTFGFTDKDFTLVDGTNFWGKSGKASGVAISKAISSSVSALINKTNIPKSATNEVVYTAVSKTTIAQLRDTCAKADIDPGETVLLLTPKLFADLLATLDANVYGGPEAVRQGSLAPGCYGFGHIDRCNAFSSAAGENLTGAIVAEGALGYCSAPLEPQGKAGLDEYGFATDPDSGLTIGFRRFTTQATGKNHFIGEVLMGAKLVQPTKVVRLVSAATA